MLRNLSSIVCLLVLGATAGAAQEPSERFYQAIRRYYPELPDGSLLQAQEGVVLLTRLRQVATGLDTLGSGQGYQQPFSITSRS